MKRLITAALLLVGLLIFAPRADSIGSRADMLAASDPYYLDIGRGEPNALIPSVGGFLDATGRTSAPLSSLTGTKAVIVTVGQSNAESAALGTFTPVNTTAINFNIYDRWTYRCANPVLGTSWNTSGLGSNSVNCQIADSLISAGTYANVIMAPISIGGTTCADWNTGGQINRRITVLMNALKARGLTPGTGFTGDFWILWHDGESDGGASPTPRATLAACIQNIAAIFVAQGSGSARFFVPQSESFSAGSTYSNVIGAQADALVGCATCRAGANWDSITSVGYRQDLTHFTAAGAVAAAALDVAIIQNCKNTSC